ncbi:hypothetical protein [Nocardioides sp. Soil805]|uniref:hypothetical protein n=1 Tax=Nocardioides sp. Soil805 TaxID=1736416 RepID=UPI0007031022|nr:hypothetical protein [Nocardioides sp. Soil805]KRF36677.1 hypothetical protein ASG94_04415 [Nocardioides sp. Soil805]
MHRITTTLTTLAATAAVVAGPLALGATTAQAADAGERRAPSYTVQAKANKEVVTVGEDVVKVRGKVTPRAAGSKVVLQQRLEGKKKWAVSSKGKIKRNGTYLLKDEPSVAGTREYRVLKPAGQGIGKGTSKVLEVQVYRWEDLARRSAGASANVTTYFTASIGTKAYAPSIVPFQPGAPAYVEYTLGRLCTGLRTTYALDDASESGATGAVKLIVDGATKVDQGLVVGQVVESTTDLTGAFRLRYELTSAASPVSRPVVGTPEVRCTK